MIIRTERIENTRWSPHINLHRAIGMRWIPPRELTRRSLRDKLKGMTLLDQYEAACKVRRLARRTIQTYRRWVEEFVRFHHDRTGHWIHPREMGEKEVEAFLTHLAVNRCVAESTQNQALAAILFLYRHVLEKDLGSLDAVRANRPKRLPTVLSQGRGCVKRISRRRTVELTPRTERAAVRKAAHNGRCIGAKVLDAPYCLGEEKTAIREMGNSGSVANKSNRASQATFGPRSTPAQKR